MNLSLSIEQVADSLGLPVAEVLRRIDVPQPTYYVWETGRHSPRGNYASRVLLMLDGLKYRHGLRRRGRPSYSPSFFRSLFS